MFVLVIGVIFDIFHVAGYLDVIRIVLKMWLIMLIMCGRSIFRNLIWTSSMPIPFDFIW
jgi:hypothetical protein